MSVQALGYVGIRAKSLEDWGAYGTKFLGLQHRLSDLEVFALRVCTFRLITDSYRIQTFPIRSVIGSLAVSI